MIFNFRSSFHLTHVPSGHEKNNILRPDQCKYNCFSSTGSHYPDPRPIAPIYKLQIHSAPLGLPTQLGGGDAISKRDHEAQKSHQSQINKPQLKIPLYLTLPIRSAVQSEHPSRFQILYSFPRHSYRGDRIPPIGTSSHLHRHSPFGTHLR